MNIIGFNSLPLQDKGKLPGCSAVYFVVSPKKEIFYIGRAENLNSRWLNHHCFSQVNRPGTQIVWMEVADKNQLPQIEKSLIQAFKPLLNNTPVFVESSDYGWVQDFLKELISLYKDGLVNSFVAQSVVREVVELSRKVR